MHSSDAVAAAAAPGLTRELHACRPWALLLRLRRLEQKGKGHAPPPEAGRVDMREVLHQLSAGDRTRHGGDEWWVWLGGTVGMSGGCGWVAWQGWIG